MRRILGAVALVTAGALLLMLLAAGFAETVIWASGALHLHRALGIDTQNSQNYAFHSGPGPEMISALGFSAFFAGLVRHINCQQKGCWRPGHRHPDHGLPVCRKHYHHDVTPPAPWPHQ